VTASTGFATTDAGTTAAPGGGAPPAGQAAAPAARRQPEPRPYDFRRPGTLGRAHLEVLQLVGEAFARRAALALQTTLRTAALVSLGPVEEWTFDQLLRSIDDPGFLAVLSLEPLEGAGVLHLPPPIAMGLVERLLGGGGGPVIAGRPLSELEGELLRPLVDQLLGELTPAFESLLALRARIDHVEPNPQFARAAAGPDPMLTFHLEVRTGESEPGTAVLCLPLAALQGPLDAFVDRASPPSERPAGPGAAAQVAERLLDAPVEVAVRFGVVALSSRELLDLGVGDVVWLGHPVGEPLVVSAGGVPFLAAVPGRTERRLACQVVDPSRFRSR
jgi:flagellar motor switch protein FliM